MTFRNYKAAHSERCDGSPYSGGMASPYSDHSAGLPSPPTVVSEYNRPYDCVNTDGPHLILTEQPQGKFRFRYKSEMVGTHGQLKAERADKNKSIFPTVKLAKWTDGPALIRLALYTGEDNVNQRRRHVHELSGKNCDRETGMCEVVVDHTTDFVATFQNLGIIHIAKRDVKDIIKQRKKAELIEHARLRRPQCTQEEIRQSITPTDMKKFDEEAEEIAKTMDLNKVVLRFQAFQYDTSVKCYRPITRAVDSELVVNLKNASTGELKIVRMSECSAPCTGGTEVWMLVEKVKKSNIRIKFFEQDTDGGEVWSAYGEFSEGDVHHQYAIIFRTPPYRTTNLRSSVRVKVQLERPNDKDISEPRDFTYYPENRKRQSPFAESTKIEEDEDYPQGGGDRPKRHCKGTSEPLDLRFSEFSQVLFSEDRPYDSYSDSRPGSSHSSYRDSYHDSHYDSYPSSTHVRSRDNSVGRINQQEGYGSEFSSSQHLQCSNESVEGNLFRSEYERQVAMQGPGKREPMQMEPKYNTYGRSISETNPENWSFEANDYEGKRGSSFLNVPTNHMNSYRRRSSSPGSSNFDTSTSLFKETLDSSFDDYASPNCGNASTSSGRSGYDYRSTHAPSNFSQQSAPAQLSPSYVSPQPLALGTPRTSPLLSPNSSPYHRPSVDSDIRLLSVQLPPQQPGVSLSPVNLSQSSQALHSELGMHMMGSPSSHGRSSSTQSVRSISDGYLDTNAQPRSQSGVPHSGSLPELWQEQQQVDNVSKNHGTVSPTYTELRTVKRSSTMRPLLDALSIPKPLDQMETVMQPLDYCRQATSSSLSTPSADNFSRELLHAAAEFNFSPTERHSHESRDGVSFSSDLSAPAVTVTPPADPSPLSAIFWNNDDSSCV